MLFLFAQSLSFALPRISLEYVKASRLEHLKSIIELRAMRSGRCAKLQANELKILYFVSCYEGSTLLEQDFPMQINEVLFEQEAERR